ncbi:MAG: DUF4157 domain-containing protein [Deltaproteobacteria bacterium]|nr:DUF4157 domain-containing protein [Deltaproteobacteria bacterium]
MNQRTFTSKKGDSKSSATPASSPKAAVQHSFSPQAPLLLVQRQLGNAAVQQMHEPGELQAKLKIAVPNDKYEREANRVADHVMRMPDLNSQFSELTSNSPPSVTGSVADNNTVQRICSTCEDGLQRQTDEEQNNLMQAKEQPGATSAVTADVASGIQSMRGRGQRLTESTRLFMEPRFGADFSGVRVHNDSNANHLAGRINARAFTVGRDIVFGSGQYSPDSAGGKRLLAHELTHTVQQGSGVVRPASVVRKGFAVSENKGLEAKADNFGEKTVRGEKISKYLSPSLGIRNSLRTVQAKNSVIQRAVTTSGGTWDTDQYDLRKDKDSRGTVYPPATGVRGVDIKLKFTPGNNVDAELIGLTQSVQGIVNKKISLTPGAALRNIGAADAININTGAGETDEGTAIDRAATYNNPIYPVKTKPSASLDDTNISANWGSLGYHYTDKSGSKHKDATLIDKPTRSGAAKDSRHIFETTALATKGTQAGTYYGSVRWGWRTDSTSNFTKIPLQVVSQGVPSSTFMKAAEIWNASKTSTGADTVNLPLVNVKLIKPGGANIDYDNNIALVKPGGSSIYYDNGVIGPHIPENTRVVVTDRTHLYDVPGMNPLAGKAKIEVVYGNSRGLTGWIDINNLIEDRIPENTRVKVTDGTHLYDVPGTNPLAGKAKIEVVDGALIGLTGWMRGADFIDERS